jgi:hypothetical protein
MCDSEQSRCNQNIKIGFMLEFQHFIGFVFQERLIMLYTIAVVLIILWLLGLVTSYTLGGFIHILLVIAIVVVLLRVITGRKPL